MVLHRATLSAESIELQSSRITYPSEAEDVQSRPRKSWLHYAPLCATVALILAPHPSLLFVLVDYHLLTLHRPDLFAIHLLVTYSLTFLAFSSMIVCMVRDPGSVVEALKEGQDQGQDLTEALMSPSEDFSGPGKFCRKCWEPKPERTHHCTHCGRCVLKMDHHCPWLGSCIGFQTYPAFVHFLGCVTLFAFYIAVLSINALCDAFTNPLSVNAVTPLHELGLAFAGIVFTLVIGSFFFYHIHLILTNQTTVENLSQFILLRELPPLGPAGHVQGLSDPPLQHELSYSQRKVVRHAHSRIHLYDVGWRKNLAQVFGWNHPWGWLYRILQGGGSNGDGKSFPRNPRSEELLSRLAKELVSVNKDA